MLRLQKIKQEEVSNIFTIPEYEVWKYSTGNDGKGYTVKYYKGLVTSTSAEAEDYFSNLDLRGVHFHGLKNDNVTQDIHESTGNSDTKFEIDSTGAPGKIRFTSGHDLIHVAFSKEHAEDCKVWINTVKSTHY